MKVVLSRVPTTPTIGKQMYDPSEENQFRSDVERAFLKLPAPSTGGGGGGGDLTAKYLLDSPASDLTNGIVIHRGLGPDRVPASPNALDDEMLNATTGYDPAKWTVFSQSGSSYAFDAKGGLVISLGSTNIVEGISQPFVGSGAGAWGFEIKAVLDSADASTNSHVGLCVRDASTQHTKCYGIGKVGSSEFSGFNFATPSTFSNSFLGGAVGGIQTRSMDFVYLRLHGNGSGSIGLDASFNGVAWFTAAALSNDGFCATINRIGIWTYQADHPGHAYVEYFRRYL